MNELKELAISAGATVMDIIIQNKDSIDSAFFIGKGKVEEVKIAAEIDDCNLVIFNNELSGSQIRNLESVLEVRVIDRTALILDIFALRASSKIAKLQVELAQLKYRLPRLTGSGISLSRTGAGIGTRGPGEQKLEIDRRRIKERIHDINRQIKDAKLVRKTQRAQRDKSDIPIIAIVGYTNAGKSTLLNKIMEKNYGYENNEKAVFAKDMLFATLDTFSRKIEIDENRKFILVDTVGFVSNLPHALVEAFKATLEEVIYCDLLLHVVDGSNSNYNMQTKVTENVLKELGVTGKEEIIVFNKMDRVKDEDIIFSSKDFIKISAKEDIGLDQLIESINNKLFKDVRTAEFLIPYDKGSYVSSICSVSKVISTEYLEKGTLLSVEIKEKDYNKYISFLVEDGD